MATQIDQWSDEGSVKIKPKAYITMLKHVLNFGNKALGSDSVEVMGICMGKQIGNDIVVYDAVPVSHGSSIEVGFTPADYAAFAQVDEEFAEKGGGIYACGWYHSHPNMKAFFSQVDIKNHLFYQKEATPKGFGIVFDHQYFDEEGHSGFKIFRLNDYAKGTGSDFHECKFELLPPEDLDVYKEIQFIIESTQSKQQIIKEIGGLDVDDSIWSVPDENVENEGQEEEIEAEQGKKSDLDEVTEGYSNGIDAFSKEFSQKFFKMFDEFKNDTSKATQKGSTVMVDVLASMKETVETGVERVKKYLEDILGEEVTSVQNSVEEMFKKFDEDQREFAKKFDELSNKMSQDISGVIKEILRQKLDPVIGIIKEAAGNADKIGNETDNFKSGLNDQQKIIEQLKNSLENDTTSINDTISMVKDKIGEESKEKSKSIHESMGDLKNSAEEISKLINDLQKKVSK